MDFILTLLINRATVYVNIREEGPAMTTGMQNRRKLLPFDS